MGAKRWGLWAILWRALLATPFLIVGVRTFVTGIAIRSIGEMMFGAIFAGAGAIIVYGAVRDMRALATRRKLATGGGFGVPVGRAALAYRAPDGAPATALQVYGPQLPLLPLVELESAPGRTLAHALGRRDASRGWWLIGSAVFWTALVGPFFIQSLSAMSVMTLFLLIFVLVGAFMLIAGLKRILALRKIVELEISAEPAFLGEVVTVQIAQRGPVKIHRLTAALVCTERTAHRVGTDTRREEREIHRAEILDEVALHVARGETWARQLQVTIPDRPASFYASSNEIAWTIAVKSEIAGWPDYEEAFVFRALPKVSR